MRKLAALLLALSLGACSGDGGPLIPQSMIGDYMLESIDGRPLPVSLGFDGERPLDITAGLLTFQGRTDCMSLLEGNEHRMDRSFFVGDRANCQYLKSGTTVELSFKTSYSITQGLWGNATAASFDADKLTITARGHTYAYRRL